MGQKTIVDYQEFPAGISDWGNGSLPLNIDFLHYEWRVWDCPGVGFRSNGTFPDGKQQRERTRLFIQFCLRSADGFGVCRQLDRRLSAHMDGELAGSGAGKPRRIRGRPGGGAVGSMFGIIPLRFDPPQSNGNEREGVFAPVRDCPREAQDVRQVLRPAVDRLHRGRDIRAVHERILQGSP